MCTGVQGSSHVAEQLQRGVNCCGLRGSSLACGAAAVAKRAASWMLLPLCTGSVQEDPGTRYVNTFQIYVDNSTVIRRILLSV